MLTQKENHLFKTIMSGVSLKDYSLQNDLSYGYVRCHLWQNIRKKLNMKKQDWKKRTMQHGKMKKLLKRKSLGVLSKREFDLWQKKTKNNMTLMQYAQQNNLTLITVKKYWRDIKNKLKISKCEWKVYVIDESEVLKDEYLEFKCHKEQIKPKISKEVKEEQEEFYRHNVDNIEINIKEFWRN